MNGNKLCFWLLVLAGTAILFAVAHYTEANDRSPLAALDCLECGHGEDVLAALNTLNRPVASQPVIDRQELDSVLSMLDAPRPSKPTPGTPPVNAAKPNPVAPPPPPVVPQYLRQPVLNQPQLKLRCTRNGCVWTY